MKRAIRLLALTALSAFAQDRVITTIAGSERSFPRVPRALDAPFGALSGIAYDSRGNLLASDYDNNIVVRISPDGTLDVIGGNGIFGLSGDGGPGVTASLNHPYGLTA